MTDRFDGDPFITIGADGADMIFRGGQPEGDAGFAGIQVYSGRCASQCRDALCGLSYLLGING